LQEIANGGVLVNRKGKEEVHLNSEKYNQVQCQEKVAIGSWEKLEVGWVKCNVDASFTRRKNRGLGSNLERS
jgi:hypothetical protein